LRLVKRLVSISMLILLTFIGISSIAHKLEPKDEHCNHEVAHFCAPDAHHHCSLCDTLVPLGFTSETYLMSLDIDWGVSFIPVLFSTEAECEVSQRLGRAPPVV